MSYPPQGPPAAEVGGFYGINVETLAAGKTLTPGIDKIYQYLDEGGSNRIITLATAGAQAGDRFVIRHNGSYEETYNLAVKQGATTLDKIYAGNIKEFIFDGTDWISRGIGTGEDDPKKSNVAVGYQADGSYKGVAIGYIALSHSYGASVGYQADSHDFGVAIGNGADGHNCGVSVGYLAGTNAKKYSIALGYYSKCERAGETSININGDDTDQENNVVQGRWEGETANDTPIEIFCAGQTNQRFLIRPNSVLAFKMTIVARDNVANEVAMYTVADGLIKRDGAGNTVMVNCTVTVVHEDDAAWDCAVSADDVNEALIITCTGDDTNPTQFAAVLEGIETHFGS